VVVTANSNAASATTDPLVAHLLQEQQKQNERQSKMMEMMMELVKGKGASMSTPVIDITGEAAPKGKVSVKPVVNPGNAQLMGLSLQPLCQVEGDYHDIDLSKLKRKLKSGENSSGSLEVAKEVRWFHHCLSQAHLSTMPTHSQLNVNTFFSGFINLVLSEAPPDLMSGTTTENKLRYGAKLATIALTAPWSDIIELDRLFFRMLEQGQITWDSWSTIQDWLHNAVEGLRAKRLVEPPAAKKPKLDHNNQPVGQAAGQPAKAPRTKVEGLDIAWMRQAQICIKFQTGICPFTNEHNTLRENITLKHICAGCEHLKKPADKSHGARSCPNKSQFFGQ
jgi:hypothetical protein